MIKVILADDQQMFLDGIKLILRQEEDIQIVGEALEGNQVLEILKTHQVDIVVLDINMPNGLDGIETAKLIKQNYPKVKVLLLSFYADKKFLIDSLEYGVSGYILKEQTGSYLVEAIRDVVAGTPLFSLKVLDTPSKKKPEKFHLTARQIEILKLTAKGNTSKEVAHIIGRSDLTVHKHLQHIYEKTGVKNKVQLTHYAITHGYIEVPH